MAVASKEVLADSHVPGPVQPDEECFAAFRVNNILLFIVNSVIIYM